MIKRSVELMSNWTKDVFFPLSQFVQEKHSFHYDYQTSAEISSLFFYFIISLLKHQKIP